jgi:phosphatidylserine/phosphatidylglycerophosphate/cardiolipin synthase-like enzyme
VFKSGQGFREDFKDVKGVMVLFRRNQQENSNLWQYAIHSKLYLFYTSDTEWRCIIGSYNLTTQAFRSNLEIAMIIDSDSDSEGEFIKDVMAMFHEIKNDKSLYNKK